MFWKRKNSNDLEALRGLFFFRENYKAYNERKKCDTNVDS